MRRISNPNDPSNDRFINRDDVNGISGTPVTDSWLNDVQEEIVAAIEGSGVTITPSTAAAVNNQLSTAIARLGFFSFVDITTSQSWTRANLAPVIQANTGSADHSRIFLARTRYYIEVVGGGGAGAVNSSNLNAGSVGGNGGISQAFGEWVDQALTFTIGAGGIHNGSRSGGISRISGLIRPTGETIAEGGQEGERFSQTTFNSGRIAVSTYGIYGAGGRAGQAGLDAAIANGSNGVVRIFY